MKKEQIQRLKSIVAILVIWTLINLLGALVSPDYGMSEYGKTMGNQAFGALTLMASLIFVYWITNTEDNEPTK